MNKLLELADRCEKATGPDRDLDVVICLATSIICDSIAPTEVKNLEADPDEPGWVLYDYQGNPCTDSVRSFTSSLDAALTLVPEGGGINIGRYWTVDGEEWSAAIILGLGHKSEAEAKTGAIAICAAALRARATLSETPS